MGPKEQLARWIEESPQWVFFGGAGVSTESGIPDFRSENGLYRQKFAYPPEVMLSRTFFDAHPREFFDFYREKMIAPRCPAQCGPQSPGGVGKAGQRCLRSNPEY